MLPPALKYSFESRCSRHLIFFSLLAVLYLLLLGCAKEKPQASAELVWLNSFDEALKIASKKDMMIMVDFYAYWCGWCKKLDETTYRDKDVIAKGENFIKVRIDADSERDLALKYRISGLPTILFIDSTGREIHRVVGYRPPEDFAKEMALAVDKLNKR